MLKGMVESVVLVCLLLCIAGCAEGVNAKPAAAAEIKVERRVKLWDVGEKASGRNRFTKRHLWKQVPYGVTDYKFKNGVVVTNPKDYKYDNDVEVENDFFYLHMTGSLHVKVDGEPKMLVNCLYRRVCGGGPYGYAGIKYLKIIKNTHEEVVLKHEAAIYPHGICPIPAIFRIFNDKRWIEITPVDRTKPTMQGIHGKVRMGLAPLEGRKDFVVDSLRDLPGYVDAPETKMLLCFHEAGANPFMWVITWSAPFKEASPCFNNDSGPKGDRMWWAGQVGCPKTSQGCITSAWARFGKKGSVVIGTLNHWHNWHRDEINKRIKKGKTYTSKWKPPYPGRWRMTVRIAEKEYDQGFKYDGKTKFPAKYFSKDVYDGNFTFTSTVDGWLDYIIMYMYDRTKETPSNIQTPMDQYRWTIRQRRSLGK